MLDGRERDSRQELTMMIDPPDLIDSFLTHVIQELFIHGVERIPKLKLRPQQNTHLYSQN